MAKKLTLDEVRSRIAEHYPQYEIPDQEFRGTAKKLTAVCPEHGMFHKKASHLMSGYSGCRSCGYNTVARKNRENGSWLAPQGAATEPEEFFVARARAVHGDKYRYIDATPSGRNKMTLECPEHGVFYQTRYDHLHSSGCQKCASEARGERSILSTCEFVRRVEAIHGSGLDFSRVDYKGQTAKVVVRCPEHGLFQKRAMDLYRKGCPKCGHEMAGKKRGLEIGDIQESVQDHSRITLLTAVLDDGIYSLLELYCDKHGRYTTKAYNVTRGSECPQCAASRRYAVSQGENDMADYLAGLGVEVERQRRISSGTRFDMDIYLPEFETGIEFDGRYWHTDEKRGKHHRKQKQDLAAENGIRLVFILDWDWENRHEAVCNFLRSLVGKAQRYMARKLRKGIVEWPQAKDFYERTHLQGAPTGGTHYGLFDGSELVACMTFGRNYSRSDKNAMELIRYSSSGTVIGGASRLFKTFTKDHPRVPILSFSANQWFNGGMYYRLGFKEVGRVAPDYKYFYRNRMLHKISFRRANIPKRISESGADPDLFDPDTDPRTEREMAELLGAERIFDTGKRKWRYDPWQIVTNSTQK